MGWRGGGLEGTQGWEERCVLGFSCFSAQKGCVDLWKKLWRIEYESYLKVTCVLPVHDHFCNFQAMHIHKHRFLMSKRAIMQGCDDQSRTVGENSY